MATDTRELNVNGQLIGHSRRGRRLGWPRLVTTGVTRVYERLAELEAGRN
jgi:hypothetical protein